MTDVWDNLGYFDAPGQTKPAHNPCADALCPGCGERNSDAPMVWRSLAPLGGLRSYFFAYHKDCGGLLEIDQFAQRALEAIFEWDDAARKLA